MEVVDHKVVSEKVEKLENKDRKEMQEQNFPSLEKHSSKDDFTKYFLNKENFNKLSESCISGDMKTLNCRWTAWRAFLGLLPVGDEAKMREEVKKQRKFYAGEHDKYLNFRSKVQLSAEVDNPLSTNSSNPWNSYYGDSDLKEEIKKDLERTYQDIEFFVAKPSQQLLENVLFIWSKQNPDISYRQGMNELAAVLTYACFTENCTAKNPETDIYEFLNDERYAEADIYTALKRIFELDQKSMFVVTQPTAKNGKPKKKTDSEGANRPNLPVVHRAVYIQETLLAKVHPNLFDHLKTLQVEPHIYLMRWLRCMLVREFKIDQALYVWDSMFAYHYLHTPTLKKFEMLDYLCVAMILCISEEIFKIDNGGMILGKLLKYPPTEKIETIIRSCHEEVIGYLSKNPPDQSGPSSPEKSNTVLSSKPSQEEERGRSVTGFGAKKVVLFSPGNPILQADPSKEKSDPLGEGSLSPVDPLAKQNKSASNPLVNEISKKPEAPKNETKLQTKLFEDKSQHTELTKKIEAPKTEEKPQVKPVEEKAKTPAPSSSDFLPGTKKNNPFSSTSSTSTSIPTTTMTFTEKKKEKSDLESSGGPLILFGNAKNNEKKDNPFSQVNKTTEVKTTPIINNVERKPANTSFKDSNASDILQPNIQKETQDQIKKLQNAIKLVKLENEKSLSLNLKEAVEDMNEVLKFLKDKLSKN